MEQPRPRQQADSTMRIRRPLGSPEQVPLFDEAAAANEAVEQTAELSTEEIRTGTGAWMRSDHEPMPLNDLESVDRTPPARVSLEGIASTAQGRLAAISTVIMGSVPFLLANMEIQEEAVSGERVELREMTPSVDIEPFINKDGEAAGVRVELVHDGVEYGLNFVDYTEVFDWEIKPGSLEQMQDVVAQNSLYQSLYEQHDFQSQYARMSKYSTAILESPVKGKLDSAYDVYDKDNARAPEGIFRMYTEVLGNLAIDDKEGLYAEYTTAKDTYGYGAVDDLTYTQWMMRIDSPTRDLEYNSDWVASEAGQVDATGINQYLAMPVDQLYAGKKATCTGYERVANTSYDQDNGAYQLADRGIFRLSVTQLADAKHAMGAYVIAHPSDPHEVYIIPVDVTNQQGDPTSDVGDVRGAEFASWMLSENVFHDTNESLADRAAVYDRLLDGYSLDHTSRAITVRELVITHIEQAEAELQRAEKEGVEPDNTVLLEAYTKAFNRLNTELRAEAQAGDAFLLRPDRALRLLFLQVELGSKINEIEKEMNPDSVSEEYTQALRMYNQYTQRMKVSPDEGMKVLATIDEMDTGTRELISEYLQAEQERLEKEFANGQ